MGGESWHQAALKADGNRSYEDFAAMAEALIGTVLDSTAAIIRSH